MSDAVIPIDRYEAKESGRAIQEAQNTVMATGAKATLAMLQELLKALKLPQKTVNVKIAINDSLAYQANVQADSSVEVKNERDALSDEQLRYLEQVIKLPESEQPAAASIPLAQDVTVTVDGKEVFRLKNGVVEKNLLAPAPEKTQEQAGQSADASTFEPEVEEKPAQAAQVEVVGEDVSEPKQAGISPSDEQPKELEKMGIAPQKGENALGQKAQATSPIVVVLNRELESNVSGDRLKDNLKSLQSGFQKGIRNLSRKVSSFLSSARDKLLPNANRDIKRDLQSLAVIDVASKLLDRFGGQTDTGKQVFEGNSFRLERQGKDLSVIAKDGRGTILSLKGGELKGSLTQKDVERFRAVDSQLGQQQGKSRQSQAEMG